MGLGLQDPSALWPQVPLPEGGWSRWGGREAGAARTSHTPSGGGRGDIPNHSLIHKSTLGLVAATRARTHTRTACEGLLGLWVAPRRGWPRGESQISASAPLPPCPALPAARAPQLSRGTPFDAPPRRALPGAMGARCPDPHARWPARPTLRSE